MLQLILVLRILHILAAAVLVGGAFFNYFLVRPALRLIPPAHAVVIGQRVGNYFTYLGWVTLIVLGITGGLRLYFNLQENFLRVFTLEYYASGSGRAILLMVLAWLVTVISAGIMTFALRPVLMSKLTVQSNPDLAAVERRRAAQMASSLWLDRLQLLNVISTTIAALGGASVLYGGLF